MKNECKDLGPWLSAHLDGELPEEERQEVENHLATCQVCKQLADELEETGSIIKDALPPGPVPGVDLSGVWEEIEAQANFGPTVWQRLKSQIERPVIWLPTAVATAAVVLLAFVLPFHRVHAPVEMSSVESVYSRTGQVMVLQTAKTGQPVIWILPEIQKEVGS